MSTNIDFKNLWNQQETAIPDTTELFEKAKSYKKKSFRKLVFTNITLILTSIVILYIWYYFKPELITSKIGIMCIVVAVCIYLFVYNKTAVFLKTNTIESDTNQYLQELVKLKEKQLVVQTTVMNMYFILLSLGIGLYMYEYTSRMKATWAIIAYVLTIAWIGLNWFIFRPMAIKKEQKSLNLLIDNFKKINNQLTEEK